MEKILLTLGLHLCKDQVSTIPVGFAVCRALPISVRQTGLPSVVAVVTKGVSNLMAGEAPGEQGGDAVCVPLPQSTLQPAGRHRLGHP